ncbi:MAG: phosphoribosylglycinamide synthetase C domain-containing protein, partial [Limosilactobacillus sp.]
DGPKVIEYNVRLGDPETQVILPRLKTDLFDLVDAALHDQPLPEVAVTPNACFGVVLASKGYPTNPLHGQSLGQLPQAAGIDLDYANVTGKLDDLKGDGGRLLMVLSQANSLQAAHDRVYDYLTNLDEPDCFYRHDIGAKAGLN